MYVNNQKILAPAKLISKNGTSMPKRESVRYLYMAVVKGMEIIFSL